MTVRLCKKCAEQSDGKPTREMIVKLALKGHWICPFGKTECGRIKESEN